MSKNLLSLDFSVGDLPCQLVRLTSEIRPTSGKNYYQHRHPSTELHYVTAGQCSIAIDKTVFHVSTNQLLLIPPTLYHYTCDTTPDSSRMAVSIQLDPPVSRTGEHLANRIFSAFSGPPPYYWTLLPTARWPRF